MSQPKTYPRQVVGAFCKHKPNEDGTPSNKAPYIKVGKGIEMIFKEGDFLTFETKKWQLENLERAVGDGKISGTNATDAKTRINKMPEWLVAEIVKYNFTS